MQLPNELITEFVKATKDETKPSDDSVLYGTAKVEAGGLVYVTIDGSTELTPVTKAATVNDGERVMVTIKDHTATVVGNLSSPAARSGDVEDLGAQIGEFNLVIADKVSTSQLNAQVARINELVADNVTIKERLVANDASIENLEANKIDAETVKATYATIENLNATNASIEALDVKKIDAETVVSTYATVENLNATNASINELEAKKIDASEVSAIYATIENLNATNASIDELEANKIDANTVKATYATIANLNATNANVNNLTADVADIDTLIFGSASGTTIQTSFANAVIAQLGNAQIKSAMIDSISAGKITAGDINTNNVRVLSEDGRLVISDETIQISDSNRVRVQIGKDASNDYSINVWDASGNLMFSKGGITDSAIKEAIIRNDMVSETANISASKLDIDSLFEEINGSEKTIKSTKIYLDDKKQTLDVAFTSVTSDVSDTKNLVSSQGTAISTIQGQISSKIWEQDIKNATDELGNEVDTLNTKYSTMEQTVGGMSTTIAEHTTAISNKADASTVTAVSDRVTSLSTDIGGFKTSVSSTYATKNELSTTDAKANAAKTFTDNASNNFGYQYKYTITLNGDASLYYPVILRGGNQDVMREIMVKRSYSDLAPAEWGGHPTVYGIGLTLKIKCNFGGWGGANYSWQIIDLEEMYGNVFASANNVFSNMGFAIFLRGGGTTGASYTLYSDQPLEVDHPTGKSPQVCYNNDSFNYNGDSTYTWTAGSPRTLTDSIKAEIAGKKFTYAANITALETRIDQTDESIALQASSISELGGRVSTLELTANGLTISLQTTDSKAESAQTTADTAIINASAAQSTATNAQSAASTAQSTATNAQSTATNAQSTATNAQTAASTAQSTANTANTAAANAQSAADIADGKAVNAQTTANTARTEAANAAKTATNFLEFTANDGLVVGNKTGGAWSGYRAQVLSSSFNILDEKKLPVAQYGADEILLGRTDEFKTQITNDSINILDTSNNSVAHYGAGEILLGKEGGFRTQVVPQAFNVLDSSGDTALSISYTNIGNESYSTIKGLRTQLIGDRYAKLGSFLVEAKSGTHYTNDASIYTSAFGNPEIDLRVSRYLSDSEGNSEGSDVDASTMGVSPDQITLLNNTRILLEAPFVDIEGNGNVTGELSAGSVDVSGDVTIDGLYYDNLGQPIRNGLVAYSSSGIDSNTTLEHLILTSTNTPTSAFYYVWTLFYSTKSTSANRAQVAVPYNSSSTGAIYFRYYYSGSWSTWAKPIYSGENFGAISGSSASISGNLTVNGTSTLSAIELYRAAPYIDFHYNSSSEDYTQRIEGASNGLRLHGGYDADNNKAVPYVTVTYTKNATTGATEHMFRSSVSDTHYLGGASYKWKDVYSMKSSINTSDRNQKKNIEPINDKYVELFDKLQPVSYEFNSPTSDRTHLGFISQDVKESMDEVGLTDLDFAAYCRDVKMETVNETDPETGETKEVEKEVLDENGDPVYLYSLRYSEFIALNTKMIQLNRQKIAEQEREIQSLHGEISALREMVEKLTTQY